MIKINQLRYEKISIKYSPTEDTFSMALQRCLFGVLCLLCGLQRNGCGCMDCRRKPYAVRPFRVNGVFFFIVLENEWEKEALEQVCLDVAVVTAAAAAVVVATATPTLSHPTEKCRHSNSNVMRCILKGQ